MKAAVLCSACGWYAPDVSFVPPGGVQPRVQTPQWSPVWGLVSSTPLGGISCHLCLCKYGSLKGNGMFTSKPKPSVVSDLDGDCTWVNGAFSKHCLAWPLIRGCLSSRFLWPCPSSPISGWGEYEISLKLLE